MASAQEASSSVSLAPRKERKRNPIALILFAAILFMVATMWAVVQFRRPYVWHARYKPFGSWAWWTKPLEWNVDAALPQIQGNIDAVTVSPNQKCVWIGGDAGLLYFSSDHGQSWTGLTYSAIDGSFRAPTDNFPCGDNATQAGAFLKNLSLTPSVYAAEAGQSAAQQNPRRSSNPQQYSPRQGPASSNGEQNPSQSSSAPAPPTGLSATVDGGSSTQNQQQQKPSQQQNSAPQGTPSQSPQQTATNPNSPQANPGGKPGLNALPNQVRENPNQTNPNSSGAQASTGASNRVQSATTSSSRIPGKPRLSGSSGQGSATGPGTSNQPPQSVKPPAQAGDIWIIDFRSGNAPIVITSDGITYSTQDSGSTWRIDQSYANPDSRVSSGGDKTIYRMKDANTGDWRVSFSAGFSRIPGKTIFMWDGSKKQLAVGDDPGAAIPLQSTKPGGQITALSFVDPQNGWAINDQIGGFTGSTRLVESFQILHTFDGGRVWDTQFSTDQSAQATVGPSLRTIHFENSTTGWVGGTDGILLKTSDGGNNWQPASRAAVVLFGGRTGTVTGPYGRFVAPWYWLALILCGVLMRSVIHPGEEKKQAQASVGMKLAVASESVAFESAASELKGADRSSPKADSETSIGNQAISDKPLEPGELDALGLGTIAAGLSFFLRNEKTKPPLVIGINGRWGSGKSSLMNLLMKDLQDFGTHPVWFNAWHHQKEDQLLAALLQAVKAQAVPGLMDTGGVPFRLKLGWKRLQRYWFHLAVISSVVFLVYRTEMYLRHTLHLSLLTLFYPPQALESLLHGISASTPGPLTVLAAILAACKVVSAGFTAFGSKPAELLSSVSRNRKIKDLDAQTSFRQRFATEFEDVTEALGRNRMLILIDDLDRCRPEKVREVLEGVNFLVSSGDCFVVLGMARDIIEHCVGLSFRRVVDTMSWGALGLGTEDIERALEETRQNPPLMKDYSTSIPGEATGDEQWGVNLEIAAKRREFARLYLDKLVQIQVSIPEPTSAQKRVLFETSEEQKKAETVAEIKTRKVLGALQRVTSIVGPVSQAALLAAVIVFGGIFIGYELKPYAQGIADAMKQAQEEAKKDNTKKDTNQTSASNAAAANQSSGKNEQQRKNDQQGGASSTASSNPNSPNAGQQPSAANTQTGPKATPKIDNANVSPQAGWLGVWPFCLTVLLAFSFSVRALRRMPQKVVRDTAPFANSLANWHPLVLARAVKNTPRTARRFQNRVRYLAMRQRAMRDGRPLAPGERLIRYLVTRGAAADALTDKQEMYLAVLPALELDKEMNEEIAAVAKFIEAGSGKTRRWEIKSDGTGIALLPIGDQPVSAKDFKAWVTGDIHIPEPLLVAFAAIHEYEEGFIEDANLFEALVIRIDSRLDDTELADKITAMRGAQKAAGWAQWHNLQHYRRAYLRLCSEISKGDAARTAGKSSAAASGTVS